MRGKEKAADWLPFSFGQSSQGHEQFVDRHIKRIRDLLDVVEGNIPAQALDMGDECSVQPGFKRQSILRPAVNCSQALHVERQQRPCILPLGRFSGHSRTFKACGICVTGV